MSMKNKNNRHQVFKYTLNNNTNYTIPKQIQVLMDINTLYYHITAENYLIYWVITEKSIRDGQSV